MLNNSKQDAAEARQQLSQLRIASEQDKLFVQVLEVRGQQCTQAHVKVSGCQVVVVDFLRRCYRATWAAVHTPACLPNSLVLRRSLSKVARWLPRSDPVLHGCVHSTRLPPTYAHMVDTQHTSHSVQQPSHCPHAAGTLAAVLLNVGWQHLLQDLLRVLPAGRCC